MDPITERTFQSIESKAQEGLKGNRDDMTRALASIQMEARTALAIGGPFSYSLHRARARGGSRRGQQARAGDSLVMAVKGFITPESVLRQVEDAFNCERLHFAELGMQALLAMEAGEEEWARVLLLTIRAQGLGGPLEPMHGDFEELL